MLALNHVYVVTATWDEEAGVWVAESNDIPGLVTEAESIDQLVQKLKVLIPELLIENGMKPGKREVPFEFVTRRIEKACVGM